MATLISSPRIYIADENGDPIVGAKLYTSITGTTTPLVTYSDAALTIPHANPIISDANGYFPAIYPDPDLGAIKFRFFDANDVNLGIDTDPAYAPADALTQDEVGAALYPPNDAEDAADVTPSGPYEAYDARRYGVVMDASGAAAANATILNDLAAAAWPFAITLKFPDGDVYIDDQIDLSAGKVSLEFSEHTAMHYTGTADQPAVIIGGGASVANFSLDCDTTHDWSDEDCVGLRLVNCRRRDIHIRRLVGFTINLQAWGSSTSGIGYNTISVLQSFDAAYHVDIHSTVANGWINENYWYLNGIDNTSSFPTDIDSYGVRIKAESGAYTGINSNVFYKPCFELEDGDSGVERIPVWLDNAGLRNVFHDARVESGRGAVMKVSSDTFAVIGNKLDVLTLIGSQFTGEPSPVLVLNTDGGLGFDNTVSTPRFGSDLLATWNSGDLAQQSFASTAARIQTQGVFYEHASDDAGVERYDGVAKILHRGIYLGGISSALGVFVDTTTHKEFILKINSATGANAAIVCYDANGAVLDDGDAGEPHVSGGSSALTADATWGFSYRTTGGNLGLLKFRVGSTVKKIKVLVNGTDAGVSVSSFSIAAVQQTIRPHAINVWSGFPGERLIDDIPSTLRNGGYTQRGMTAYNDDAASAVASYWQCTASGWNASAWVLSTAYVLGQMAENDTGKIYVCIVAGTSAGSGGPTGTGSSITDGTVTWKYIGTLATWTAGPSNP